MLAYEKRIAPQLNFDISRTSHSSHVLGTSAEILGSAQCLRNALSSSSHRSVWWWLHKQSGKNQLENILGFLSIVLLKNMTHHNNKMCIWYKQCTAMLRFLELTYKHRAQPYLLFSFKRFAVCICYHRVLQSCTTNFLLSRRQYPQIWCINVPHFSSKLYRSMCMWLWHYS